MFAVELWKFLDTGIDIAFYDHVQEEEVTNVGNVEAEDCGHELQSQGEELVAGSEEMAPLSKKKRSNTVKRCSAHATGLTFESASLGDETEGMDDVENAPGINGGINEDDPGGSDFENGNEDMEDRGGASDSEKGNEGNADAQDWALGLNSGWSDGWSGEEIASWRKQGRWLPRCPSQQLTLPSQQRRRKPSEEALTGMDDQNGKREKAFAMDLHLYL